MRKPTIANPCAHTAELSGLIATDAASLVELLDGLIGAGSDDANTLACARLMVARVGALADTLAVAHGGEPWSSDFNGWMLQSDSTLAAFRALQPLRASQRIQA